MERFSLVTKYKKQKFYNWSECEIYKSNVLVYFVYTLPLNMEAFYVMFDFKCILFKEVLGFPSIIYTTCILIESILSKCSLEKNIKEI